MENQRLERLVIQITGFCAAGSQTKKTVSIKTNPARIARLIVKPCALASKFSDSDEDEREQKSLERLRKKLLANLAPKKTD